MSIDDYWLNAEAVTADLIVLEELRAARQRFSILMCEKSADKSEDVQELIRAEAMFEFSEFFYLLKARAISEQSEIAMLAEMHNAHIVSLMKDHQKMKRLGLKPDRLLQAIFTADTLPRLLQNWRDKPGAMDQSNLARFLVTLMSAETTRKLIVAGVAAGFLDREKTPYGTLLVSSTGIMETIFGGAIRGLRHNVQMAGYRS